MRRVCNGYKRAERKVPREPGEENARPDFSPAPTKPLAVDPLHIRGGVTVADDFVLRDGGFEFCYFLRG